MTIEDVAHELYGLPPEEFTAARNARVKQARASGDSAGAAEVQALRKPTAGAWLLNQLVRRHDELVSQVLELGARLRAAQGALGADEMRALDRQRRQLTRAVAEQARALAVQDGRRVSASAVAEVEESLRSAMVDPAAGDALRTGLLVDTFSATGLEPVDLSRVLALGGTLGSRTALSSREEPTPTQPPDAVRQRRLADAAEAVAQAQAALGAAREGSRRAVEEAAKARQRRERLESEQQEARRRLADVEARLVDAVAEQEVAEQEEAQVVRQEESAVREAERLREELEGLQ